MELTKVTRHDFPMLRNGEHKLEYHGQWEHFYIQVIHSFFPKQSEQYISPKLGHDFVRWRGMNLIQLGHTVQWLPDINGPPYYSVASSIEPQHHISMDSSTFDLHGSFLPSLRSFGVKQGSYYRLLEKMMFYMSSTQTKSYASWLCAHHVGLHMSLECKLYDLCSTQFFAPKHGKGWIFERTMARKMAQKTEELMGVPTTHYKGIRWRPERKHAWVVELMLHDKKKIWVGNFDTQEEAIQAYDEAAKLHGKQTIVKVEDASQHVLKCTSHSNKCVEAQPHTTNIAIDPSTLHNTPFDNLGIWGGPHDPDGRTKLLCPSSYQVSNSNPNMLEELFILDSQQAQQKETPYLSNQSFDNIDTSMYSCNMTTSDLHVVVDNAFTMQSMSPVSSLPNTSMSSCSEIRTKATKLGQPLEGVDLEKKVDGLESFWDMQFWKDYNSLYSELIDCLR